MLTPEIIFIVGPTASGKSDAAVLLAQKVHGEILSCDSMQVYKEIQIASNKPCALDLAVVPHHLIDIVSVSEEFDVARFNHLALQHIQEVVRRGGIPVITGGSGMYMQILLDGIFQGRGTDPALREALLQELQEQGGHVLYEKLRRLDPDAASRTHPNDWKRIIRTLEMVLTENKPVAELHKQRQGLWGKYRIALFGLNCDRLGLYQKIEARVDRMFEAGIVEEIRRLNGTTFSKTAEGIIGVKEVRGYLNGEYSEDRARDLMKLHTRRLAKRQLTWFRKEKRIHWLMLSPGEASAAVVQRILDELQTLDGPESGVRL